MPSYFDQLSHTFQCATPQCRKIFKETYRSLLKADEVVCPKCRTTIDIRESKRTGDIGKWFHTLTELDKQTDEKK